MHLNWRKANLEIFINTYITNNNWGLVIMNQESQKKVFHSTALMFHMTIYAYQKSIGNIVGNGSGAILSFVIPYLMEMLSYMELPELSKSKSIDENISAYLSMINENGYIMDANLIRESDNAYTFEILNCKLAKCNHTIFKSGYICPFAILAAAVVFYKTGANISIKESIFNETGSKTLFTLHEKVREKIS
jgi:hypothetical protein